MATTSTGIDFPLPKYSASMAGNPLGYAMEWKTTVATHGESFLTLIDLLGGEAITQPEDAQYFRISHKGRHFHLGSHAITQKAPIQELASSERMDMLHAITNGFLQSNKETKETNYADIDSAIWQNLDDVNPATQRLALAIIADFLREEGHQLA